MREIKFRRWERIPMLRMSFQMNYNPTLEYGEAYINDAFIESEHDLHKESILMQYTGLNDSNGIEIYEGDICKLSDEEPYSNEYISTDYDWEMIGKVVYRYGSYWVRMVEDRHILIPLVSYFNSDMRLDIIGNEFENPELLEVNP